MSVREVAHRLRQGTLEKSDQGGGKAVAGGSRSCWSVRRPWVDSQHSMRQVKPKGNDCVNGTSEAFPLLFQKHVRVGETGASHPHLHTPMLTAVVSKTK